MFEIFRHVISVFVYQAVRRLVKRLTFYDAFLTIYLKAYKKCLLCIYVTNFH